MAIVWTIKIWKITIRFVFLEITPAFQGKTRATAKKNERQARHTSNNPGAQWEKSYHQRHLYLNPGTRPKRRTTCTWRAAGTRGSIGAKWHGADGRAAAGS